MYAPSHLGEVGVDGISVMGDGVGGNLHREEEDAGELH